MRVAKIISLAIISSTLLASASIALAKGLPGTGALLAPSFAEYSIKAGGQVNGKLLVRNEGDSPTDYNIEADGAAVKNEAYERTYSRTTNPESLETWVHLDRNTFHLESGEQTSIAYTITAPWNAAPGTHSADLLVSAINKKQTITGAVGVESIKRVGSHLYVAVDGPLKKAGAVDYFRASSWQTGSPLEANLRMLNTGNVHYFANVDYRITDFFGNEKFHFLISPVVLPNAPRTIPLTWDKAPSFGFYKLGGTVHYFDKTEILPTRYVLLLSPTAFLLVLAAVAALIGYAYWSRPKNVRRRR